MISNNHSERTLIRSVWFTAILYVLTAVHHYYGAIIYNSPWRKAVVWQGATILIICLIFVYLYRYRRKRIFLLIYLLISFLIFGVAIGLVEGAYNHALKDILYFTGMNPETWRRLFPAPTYEIPDNFLFESTGILQFFLGVMQIVYLWRTYKTDYQMPVPAHSERY